MLAEHTTWRLFVGTWAAAEWVIHFYERHGFRVVSIAEKERLLRAYWSVSLRQQECSVVLGVSSSKTTSTLPLKRRKKSQIFSALVLTFKWPSISLSAFKTTITVIALWTSMPTYLTLFIGCLIAVRNLGHCLFKITANVASFHITCQIKS